MCQSVDISRERQKVLSHHLTMSPDNQHIRLNQTQNTTTPQEQTTNGTPSKMVFNYVVQYKNQQKTPLLKLQHSSSKMLPPLSTTFKSQQKRQKSIMEQSITGTSSYQRGVYEQTPERQSNPSFVMLSSGKPPSQLAMQCIQQRNDTPGKKRRFIPFDSQSAGSSDDIRQVLRNMNALRQKNNLTIQTTDEETISTFDGVVESGQQTTLRQPLTVSSQQIPNVASSHANISLNQLLNRPSSSQNTQLSGPLRGQPHQPRMQIRIEKNRIQNVGLSQMFQSGTPPAVQYPSVAFTPNTSVNINPLSTSQSLQLTAISGKESGLLEHSNESLERFENSYKNNKILTSSNAPNCQTLSNALQNEDNGNEIQIISGNSNNMTLEAPIQEVEEEENAQTSGKNSQQALSRSESSRHNNLQDNAAFTANQRIGTLLNIPETQLVRNDSNRSKSLNINIEELNSVYIQKEQEDSAFLKHQQSEAQQQWPAMNEKISPNIAPIKPNAKIGAQKFSLNCKKIMTTSQSSDANNIIVQKLLGRGDVPEQNQENKLIPSQILKQSSRNSLLPELSKRSSIQHQSLKVSNPKASSRLQAQVCQTEIIGTPNLPKVLKFQGSPSNRKKTLIKPPQAALKHAISIEEQIFNRTDTLMVPNSRNTPERSNSNSPLSTLKRNSFKNGRVHSQQSRDSVNLSSASKRNRGSSSEMPLCLSSSLRKAKKSVQSSIHAIHSHKSSQRDDGKSSASSCKGNSSNHAISPPRSSKASIRSSKSRKIASLKEENREVVDILLLNDAPPAISEEDSDKTPTPFGRKQSKVSPNPLLTKLFRQSASRQGPLDFENSIDFSAFQKPPLYNWSTGFTMDGSNSGIHKMNQDSHLIIENLMLDPDGQNVSIHLVADGHGPNGHHVSRMIVDRIPQIIKRLLTEGYETFEQELWQMQMKQAAPVYSSMHHHGGGPLLVAGHDMHRSTVARDGSHNPSIVSQSLNMASFHQKNEGNYSHNAIMRNPVQIGGRWELTKKRQTMIKQILTNAFEEIHYEVCQQQRFDVRLSGSTLTLILIEGDTLYCANVGDSKAIMIWDQKKHIGRGGPKEAQPQQPYTTVLTAMHHPDQPKEKLRIIKSKGSIRSAKSATMLNQGEKPVMRIYFKDMDTPGLAMSRSIGDTDAHSIGVIEIPDIQIVKLDPPRITYMIVMASDGLWNVFGSALVYKFIKDIRFGPSQQDDQGEEQQEMALNKKGLLDSYQVLFHQKMSNVELRDVCIKLCHITRRRWNEIQQTRAGKVLSSKAEVAQRIATAFKTIATNNAQQETASESSEVRAATPQDIGAINRAKGSIDDITIVLIDINEQQQ